MSDDIEDLMRALDHLRYMAIVVERSVGTICFPGIRHSENASYFYISADDRDIVGFATFNVLERLDELRTRSSALLDRYLQESSR